MSQHVLVSFFSVSTLVRYSDCGSGSQHTSVKNWGSKLGPERCHHILPEDIHLSLNGSAKNQSIQVNRVFGRPCQRGASGKSSHSTILEAFKEIMWTCAISPRPKSCCSTSSTAHARTSPNQVQRPLGKSRHAPWGEHYHNNKQQQFDHSEATVPSQRFPPVLLAAFRISTGFP